MRKRVKPIAGIDLGSSKITSVIAEVLPDEVIIRGINSTPSKSIVKGVIRDLNQCAAEIDASFSGAVYSSGIHVEQVHLAVTCKDLVSVPLAGEIRLDQAKNEITQEHIDRLLASIKMPRRDGQFALLQRIVQEFEVNKTAGVRNPLGMFGERLAVKVQDVIGPEWLLNNYRKALDRVGLTLKSLIPSVLAAGEAVLTTEEMNTGCVLLDLGHGTTDLALYRDGSAVYTDTIPVGIANLESDLMQGLGVSLHEAQRIRRSFLKAWISLNQADADDIIDVKFYGHNEYAKVKKHKVMEIVLPRLDEWAQLVKRGLRESGLLETIPGGVVLTGGGCYLREVTGFFQQHLGKPVRIGIPRGYSHLFEEFRAPQFAAALGITSFARREEREHVYKPGFLENVAEVFMDFLSRLGPRERKEPPTD
ncbi:MAG: cell division protein FtsA [Candidatus Riflebacteria bacterium RBG_13_59_9]|nr:MAG: cell division protein FtsA [Candidatus Riflebacteria bacterium RBG_13_59_9]